MNQEIRDPFRETCEDILYGSERKRQKKDKQKQRIKEGLEMIVVLGTFIGFGIFFVTIFDYLPDNIIKRILLSLNGGVGAVCVLLASSFMSWLSLILFDIIYKKITD